MLIFSFFLSFSLLIYLVLVLHDISFNLNYICVFSLILSLIFLIINFKFNMLAQIQPSRHWHDEEKKWKRRGRTEFRCIVSASEYIHIYRKKQKSIFQILRPLWIEMKLKQSHKRQPIVDTVKDLPRSFGIMFKLIFLFF